MSAYRIDFDETKYMLLFFLIKNDELLKTYNKIWKKILKNTIDKDLIVNQYSMKNI